jgi:hypothetical protein
MRQQLITWTPLPNGRVGSNEVQLSIFVSPRLSTDEGSGNPTLELFPDWANWPQTISSAPGGPIQFAVSWGGRPATVYSPTLTGLSEANWAAIFDPSLTSVTSYQYKDFSASPMHSFSASGVQSFVASNYGNIGAYNGGSFVSLATLRGRLELAEGAPQRLGPVYNALFDLANSSAATGGLGNPSVSNAVAFHRRNGQQFIPPVPVLDFHQAIASFNSFPDVLANLGLVFTLTIPIPAWLGTGTTTIQVTPQWTSSFTGAAGQTSIDVPMTINATLSATQFLPAATGVDYKNGMLDLGDTSRFSVIDLDVDGASESLTSLSYALQGLFAWERPLFNDGDQVAMSVPTLRSVGPSIMWSGWGQDGNGLNELAARQTTINTDVTNWVNATGTKPALPVLNAPDVIRGWRFDVLDVTEATPTWRSLHQRAGTYAFGTLAPTTLNGPDEGAVVPGATSPTTTTGPLPDLYVHESIARWAGWSLSAPRPGGIIDTDDQADADPAPNTASSQTDSNGNLTAQLAVNFTPVGGSLPRLRFGRKYRYRARAVDLGGYSVPHASTDGSTATAAIAHYRYEPVLSPLLAAVHPLGPAEATLLLVIYNAQPEGVGSPLSQVASNARWLFPPKSSEVMLEELGMLDGYVPGHPPDRTKPPTAAAYALLNARVDKTLADVPGVQTDAGNNNAFYLPLPTSGVPPVTSPAWLPDPLARGVTFFGVPGGNHLVPWPDGLWPNQQGMVLKLAAGAAAGNHLTTGTTTTAPELTVTLPPAGVTDIKISSALASGALDILGVWSWIKPLLPAGSLTPATDEALEGLNWMLTPFKVIRLVHAVRLPLVAPAMRTPELQSRDYGSTTATLTDPNFVMDAPSTASIDVEATWQDPLDDPSDPTNNPATDMTVSTGHAFKLHVPDPSPIGPNARPMTVLPPTSQFDLYGRGAIHAVGDTKHHAITYTATATSRFVEFFTQTTAVTLTGTTPFVLSTLGLDTTAVRVVVGGTTPAQEVDPSNYVLDATAGTIALTSAGSSYSGQALEVTWAPTDTSTGAGHLVQILSSARPAAPKVVKVSPAWEIATPGHQLSAGPITYRRIGGYLRVYLDRPWWSSGANEMLGVVALPAAASQGAVLPADVQYHWVTTMGLDPISVSSLTEAYPVSPTAFTATTPPPFVPYRPVYSYPPQLPLIEEPGGRNYDIWPYPVNYDKTSGLWFSDVAISVGTEDAAPPPGHFVRLALVRFQPFSTPGAEISTVTLATFAQPVANRTVSAVQVATDPTGMTLSVTVEGPAYYGYRPIFPPSSGTVYDVDNQFAQHPFSDGQGQRATSMMVVEVQVQDTSKGLSGDLAWRTPTNAIFQLQPEFNDSTIVTWASATPSGAPGGVTLPYPVGSQPMRLRISELDYPANGMPAQIDTRSRRPFVAFLPVS